MTKKCVQHRFIPGCSSLSMSPPISPPALPVCEVKPSDPLVTGPSLRLQTAPSALPFAMPPLLANHGLSLFTPSPSLPACLATSHQGCSGGQGGAATAGMAGSQALHRDGRGEIVFTKSLTWGAVRKLFPLPRQPPQGNWKQSPLLVGRSEVGGVP